MSFSSHSYLQSEDWRVLTYCTPYYTVKVFFLVCIKTHIICVCYRCVHIHMHSSLFHPIHTSCEHTHVLTLYSSITTQWLASRSCSLTLSSLYPSHNNVFVSCHRAVPIANVVLFSDNGSIRRSRRTNGSRSHLSTLDIWTELKQFYFWEALKAVLKRPQISYWMVLTLPCWISPLSLAATNAKIQTTLDLAAWVFGVTEMELFATARFDKQWS